MSDVGDIPTDNVAEEQITVNVEDPSVQNSDSRISCWVCFASDEDDQEAEWVKPCRCRGTTKWVHQNCLQRWIDEKQKGNSMTVVSCPQCNTEYVLVLPPFGALVYMLDVADRIIYKICPLATAGIVVGSIYWTAVTYGAVTVMQILGHKEGLSTMEQADPLVLLVGLPTIPIMLVLGKMVRWEDYLLKLWRKYWTRIPGLQKLLGSNGTGHTIPERPPAEQLALSDPVSATRVLCGALLLPTMATVFGRICFSHVPSNPQRALLGGIAFVAIKGVFKMYLRQQQYVRQSQRKILNFDKDLESHTPESGSSSGQSSSSNM